MHACLLFKFWLIQGKWVLLFLFLRQSLYVALDVLELYLDQTGLKLIEMDLPPPP